MKSFTTILKSSVFIILCMHLNACAISKEHFDCPHGKGVGCRSITEVNQMVDRGTTPSSHESSRALIGAATSATLVPVDPAQMRLDFLAVNRVSEAPLKIWFAPNQDEQGNFHEASVIHTVLKPGFWQVEDF